MDCPPRPQVRPKRWDGILRSSRLCNDCHTPNWLPAGDVPEDQWLTGSPVGYEGPWGVTFPSNLRLSAQDRTEDEWVEMLQTRSARDPMPWIAVNQMSESDSRAFYRFLRSLGPAGERMPNAIMAGPDDHGALCIASSLGSEHHAPGRTRRVAAGSCLSYKEEVFCLQQHSATR